MSATVGLAAFYFGPAQARVTASGSGSKVARLTAQATLLTLDNMLPGEEGQASVDLANGETAAEPATLTIVSVSDRQGQVGGALSRALELEVADGDTELYRGPFVAGREIGLGNVGADATKRFALTVRFRDGGRPSSLTDGDNALQTAGLAVELRWRTASVAPNPGSSSGGSGTPNAPQQQPSGNLVVIPVGTAADSKQSTRTPVCLSRRRFTIRVRESKAHRLRSARVTVNGRAVRTRRRQGRLTAVVDLRGAKRSTVRIRIVARTAHGNRIVGSRVYRTCTAKLIGKRPPRL
jgi:hypothetical protein